MITLLCTLAHNPPNKLMKYYCVLIDKETEVQMRLREVECLANIVRK